MVIIITEDFFTHKVSLGHCYTSKRFFPFFPLTSYYIHAFQTYKHDIGLGHRSWFSDLFPIVLASWRVVSPQAGTERERVFWLDPEVIGSIDIDIGGGVWFLCYFLFFIYLGVRRVATLYLRPEIYDQYFFSTSRMERPNQRWEDICGNGRDDESPRHVSAAGV